MITSAFCSKDIDMSHGKFGTAINCIDGRVQLPLINWMKEQYHLDYVDSVTEAGPDKIMAEQGPEVASIKARVNISVKAHGSKILIIAGHYDCAANPVDEAVHREQIKSGIRTAASWNLPLENIIGVWINKDWKPEEI